MHWKPSWCRAARLGVALTLGGVIAGEVHSQSDSLPPGVTRAMIDEGRRLWGGQGLCLACHGPEGKGGLGPDLTDGRWDHTDGSYEQLVAVIIKGVMSDASKSGQIMPPRGGGGLNDEQVKAVAAYVWTLNRRPPRE